MDIARASHGNGMFNKSKVARGRLGWGLEPSPGIKPEANPKLKRRDEVSERDAKRQSSLENVF
jgi:hypothetical protein